MNLPTRKAPERADSEPLDTIRAMYVWAMRQPLGRARKDVLKYAHECVRLAWHKGEIDLDALLATLDDVMMQKETINDLRDP